MTILFGRLQPCLASCVLRHISTGGPVSIMEPLEKAIKSLARDLSPSSGAIVKTEGAQMTSPAVCLNFYTSWPSALRGGFDESSERGSALLYVVKYHPFVFSLTSLSIISPPSYAILFVP